MGLNISTFVNQKGCSFFKALGHPMVQNKLNLIVKELNSNSYSIYDPEGMAQDFLSLTSAKNPQEIYVQATEKLTDHDLKGVQQISDCKSDIIFIPSFAPERYINQIRHLIPKNAKILSLENDKLDDKYLSIKDDYLNELNFATNFCFMREKDGWHTRMATANYWNKYGAKDLVMEFWLFDMDGNLIKEWSENLENSQHSIVVDSQDIKKRFNLDDFMGQMFIQVVGAKGHSIVKYALDTYHDSGAISATHDANAWPSDSFGGLPAPKGNEKVILWLQNSHPVEINPGEVVLRVTGTNKEFPINQSIKPFATMEIDVGELAPGIKWPSQLEIEAGKYFVRPRYEVINDKNYRCIAHVNVQREDLKPDHKLKDMEEFIGKGYILPAPILSQSEYSSTMLNTPMVRGSNQFPVKALFFSKDGHKIGEHKFGNLSRDHGAALHIDEIVDTKGDFGHAELVYDFDAGIDADTWLHGLFRYKNKNDGSQAETSFGSHIFNNIMTYKNEPQSYRGAPPGLTTGLFLRVHSEYDTFCHLIYPVSKDWHKESSTILSLMDSNGHKTSEKILKIPASGSRLWWVHETFDKSDLEKAKGGYVFIDDRTCRLFGYHGVRNGNSGFSMDHMFGF